MYPRHRFLLLAAALLLIAVVARQGFQSSDPGPLGTPLTRDDPTGTPTAASGGTPIPRTSDAEISQAQETPAPSARSIDLGESFPSPDGPRRLLRRPGWVAIQPTDAPDNPRFIAELILPGGALEGYRIRKIWPNKVYELEGPASAIAAEIKDPLLNRKRLAALRTALPADLGLASPIHLDPESLDPVITFGSLIVALQPGLADPGALGIDASHTRALRGTDDQFIISLADQTPDHLLAEVKRLSRDPRVRWAEPDFMITHTFSATPNDPLYRQQWHLENTGQEDGVTDADVDAATAWNTTTGSSDIIIAVIDDGFDLNHEDLRPNLYFNPGESGTKATNGIDDDGNGYIDDLNGWDFRDDDNLPGYVERSALGSGTPFSTIRMDDVAVRISQASTDADEYNWLNGEYTLGIQYYTGFLGTGAGAGYEFHLFSNDGSDTENATVLREADEGDVPDDKQTEYDTLIALVEQYLPDGDSFSTSFQANTDPVDQIKILCGAVFGFPYEPPAHGTAVSGVALARGDNGKGVSGIAPRCSWLPIKPGFTSSTFAETINYCSSFRGRNGSARSGADIINMSLSGGGSISSADDTAFNNAFDNGRDGRGMLVFASTGNSASAWISVKVSFGSFFENIVPADRKFQWRYTKDGSNTAGEDAIWIDDITASTGDAAGGETFDDNTAEDFTMSPANSWTIVTDPARSRGTSKERSMKTAPLAANSSATLTFETNSIPGTLSFKVWVSCDSSDKFEFLMDDVVLFSLSGDTPSGSNIRDSITLSPSSPDGASVSVPDRVYRPIATRRYASHPKIIGVGGSTSYNTRVDYSQYGTLAEGLDLVTPTGFLSGNIRTTDISGSSGYDTGDYTSGFNGTSSSAPLASGIGALLLSVNPDLESATARDLLHESCDKIGDVTYTNDGSGRTRNDFYGYGKLNAAKAVQKAIDSYGLVKPENLAGTINGIRTSITYDYPYEVSKYVLYKNDSPTTSGAANSGFVDIANPPADFTLATGTRYYALKVYGPFDGQESQLSDWIAVTRPIPSPQRFIASKGRFFNRVEVSWFGVDAIDDYVLTRTKNGGSPQNITLPADAKSYSDTDLALGDTVTYSLVARTGAISSNPVTDSGFLGEPVSISATQGTVPGGITITWDPIPNALGGSLYRTTTTSPPIDADNSGRPDQQPLTSFFISGGYTDNTAADGVPYYYWVAGYNADNQLTALSGPALGFTAPSPEHINAGNSVDQSGPAFQWIDISQTGTAILTTGDDVSAPINPPFGLNFFGDTIFNSLSVSSNGYIATSDSDGGNDYDNDCPLPTTPNRGDTSSGRIYVYHDDLDLRPAGAEVYYQEFFYFPHTHRPVLDLMVPERVAIVQWNNVVRLGETTPFSFQVIMFPNGDLVYQYLPGHPGGGSATIGIQNPPANDALTISCNQTGIIPTNQPYSVLLKAPDTVNWFFPSEATVTTHLDEFDGDLGLGTGDSMREIIFLTGATYIRFDPSLAGKTITVTGDPLLIAGRTWDGRDAPGLVISGGGTQRPFIANPNFSADLKNLTIADSDSGSDSGGLFNTSRFLSLENVTIRNCRSGGNGGAIRAFDDGFNSATVLLQNVTFSGNFCSGSGGAIYFDNPGSFSIVNCTFADNRGLSGPEGIDFNNASNGIFRNNIVDNTGAIGTHTDIADMPASVNLGNNIFASASGTSGVLKPTDLIASALLEPLTMNDGPVPVHAFKPGSPAIDAADPAATPVDAHRKARPIDGNLDGVPLPDIGAYESPQPNLIVTTPLDTTLPNDGLLSLREAVTAAASIPNATIGFDANAMGGTTCTLSGANIPLNSGKRLSIQASPDAFSAGNLIGFWRFDEAPRGIIRNEASPADNLTLYGNAFLTSSNTRPGFGSALDADTIIDTAVNTSPANVAPAKEITVAAWVRPTTFQAIGGIAGYHESATNNRSGYYLTTAFSSKFSWRIVTGTDDLTTLISANTYSPGQWHFVVGTYDGSELRLYVNGILDKVEEATGPIDYTPVPPQGFHVGRYTTSTSTIAYDGLIDDVMIFDKALSSSEVRALQGLAPATGITIDANGNPQTFRVSNSTEAYLENLNLTGATDSGLVVDNGSKLTLDGCTVFGNTSNNGGGAIRNYGITAMNRSTVRDNTATAAWGGAIDNVFGGRLTLNYCTVSNNQATAGNGGGIDNFSNATLILNHTTISGNSASANGGGVHNFSNSSVEAYHSTITNNSSGNANGHGIFTLDATSQASHTIIAANQGSDVAGPLTSLGHNLIGDDSDATLTGDLATTIVHPEAGLAPTLADNGGATRTHALLPASPALDGGALAPSRDITKPSDPVTLSATTSSPPSHPASNALDDQLGTTFQAFDNNLLALWDFNDPSNTGSAVDRIGSYSATYLGGASTGASGTGRTGLVGDSALQITGPGQAFFLSNISFLNPVVASDAVTISFWQKRTDSPPTPGYALLAGSPSSATGNGLGVKLPVNPGDNRIEFATTDPSGSNPSLISPVLASVNWSNWNHIAVVKNGFQREIYFNGTRIATGTSAPPLVADFASLFIGTGLPGFYDDIAFYNGALSADDIQALANASVPPGTASLTISPAIGLASINALELGVGNSAQASDPASYRIEGSLDNVAFSLIAEGEIPAFPGRFSTQTLRFQTSSAYSHFRVSFLSNFDPSASPVIEVAEVALLDDPVIDQRDRPRLADGDGDRIKRADIGAYEAQVFTVDSPLDGPLVEFDPNSLSGNQLRSAIQSLDSADFIVFDSVTMNGTTIALDPAKGPLLVDRSLVLLTDNLPDGLTIDGGGASPGLVDIATGAAFTADSVTFTGATAPAIVNRGDLRLSRCLLHDNENLGTDGGALDNLGSAFIDNTTFSNNLASNSVPGFGRGGAIYNRGGIRIDFCTVANNGANSGGGINSDLSAVTFIGNTIVADNLSTLDGPDISGSVLSLGYNHVGDPTDSSGLGVTDTFGPAFLSPLADNGGPGFTHAPQFNSPALDSGNLDPILGFTTDQRGAARTTGTAPDRGAHEHNPLDLASGADSDGDSLPDSYERFFGFNPNDPGDTTADLDGDGFNALEEFRARTNPYDRASLLQITGAAAVDDDRIRITWASVPGVTYSIWTSSDLTRFEGISGSTKLANASSSTATIDRSAGRRFLQVRTGPAPGDDIREVEIPE